MCIQGQPTNPDTWEINKFDTTFTYKVHDIDNDEVTGGSQTIQVDDTIATITGTTDATLNEKDLSTGTDPHPGETTQTGTITVDASHLGGSYDIKFDPTQTDSTWTDSDGTNTPGLSSNGQAVHYEVSPDGHTLIAKTTVGNVIFTVDITNPSGTNPGYKVKLYDDLDHETALLENGNLEFDFNITLTDDDGDKSPSTFKVSIVDDVTPPLSKDLIVNEEGNTGAHDTSAIINTNANANPSNTVILTDGTYGHATILSNGKLEYVPSYDGSNSIATNFSGPDTIVYRYTDPNGATHDTIVNVTVDPVSDAPTLTVVSATVHTKEDTSILLGLNAPVIVDATDQNGSGTAGDWSEGLGLITISGVPAGGRLFKTVGANEEFISTGAPITILINDINTIDGLPNADLVLSQYEYKNLKIDPVAQSGVNIPLTISVTSYEVDANNQIINDHAGNPVPGATTTTNLVVDVQAVTDNVDIDKIIGATASGDEDSWIRVDDTFTITPTVDQDGSEIYTIIFDGANLPTGTLYKVDNGAPIDASNGFSITLTNSNGIPNVPKIYIKTPDNDSADINNIEVTISVLDTDADSGGVITPKTDKIFIDVKVDPIANDITVRTDESKGNEDKQIALNLHFDIRDTLSVVGNETLTSVTIADIPDGAKIYSGSTLVNTNAGDTSVTLTIGTNANEYSQADIEGLKILPPAHSSEDFTLQVSAKTQDIDDDGGVNPTVDTGSIAAIPVVIEVLPVTEKVGTDTASPSGDDVTINGNHDYTTNNTDHAKEDDWYKLDRSALPDADTFKPFATNEDDENNGSIHGSETTTIIFNHATDGGTPAVALSNVQLQYTDSAHIKHTFSLNTDVEVPLKYLDSVEIKGPHDYSGVINIDMKVRTQDHDENNASQSGGVEESPVSTLTIQIDPVKDAVTQSVSDSKGLEDAGRNADGTVSTASAAGGIVINASVKSADTDGSEHINVYFDKIPEDAAIYYDINHDGTKEIITMNTVLPDIANGPGNTGSTPAIVKDAANHTWKLLIEDYSDTHDLNNVGDRDKPRIIPSHNSNEDITLDLNGYSVDIGGGVTETSPLSGTTYHTKIVVTGVADVAIHTDIHKEDIDITVDPTTQDLTVALNGTPNSGKYSVVQEEDMNNTQVGAEFNFKNIYLDPAKLNSYDNEVSNDPDQNPTTSDTSVASETLSIVIKDVGAEFEVVGATLTGGTGASRVWVTNAVDIASGSVAITTQKHFSGEINFKLEYVTTENDGDTQTSSLQDVSLLVTPEAEGITNILKATTDVKEDQLTHMTFSTTTTLPDSDEYISSLGIVKTGYTDSNSIVHKGIDGADFTIYIGNGASKETIQDIAAASSDHRVELVTENGVEFYKIENISDWNNLYVLYDADIGGKEDPANVSKTHQTDFGFKFDVSDDTIAVQNGTVVTLTDTESGFHNTADYTFNLTPVTDDITADAQGDQEITDIDGDANTDITVSGHDVTISGPTTINVAIQIAGVDSDGNGQLDKDKSEQIRHIRVEGVPDGIGIDDGKFIGNVTGQPNTGIWLVDLQNPIEMDGLQQTYNLKFLVDANYDNFIPTSGTAQDIHISVINQEYDINGVAQATAQTGDFTLKFTKDPTFGGTSTHAPMDILDTNGDTTNEDGYSIRSTFSGFTEDTSVKLKNIINLDVNDVQGNPNTELSNTPIDSNLFSITLEDLNGATVNVGGRPIHSGTTTGWHIETVTDNLGVTKDIYTYRGAGNEDSIRTALDLLVITPDLNRNSNNIIGTNIGFTTTLTTYTQSGVKDVVTTSYSGDIKPVTDPMTVVPTTVNVDEDVTQTISFALDTVDNSFGATYATVVDSNGQPLTKVAFTYIGSSNVGNGQFGVTLGGVHFNPGETKDVPVTISGGKIDLDFLADSNESGQAHFSYEIYSKEVNASNIEQSHNALDIEIAPIADGVNTGTGNAVASGDEDTFIQVKDANGNPITGDLIDHDTSTSNGNTTPEELKTVIIGDVPPGWLVYYGTGTPPTLAQNLGDPNGTGKNSWNIPLGTGANPVPDIWVKAPDQLGGITATFDLMTGVVDGGQQIYSHTPIDVTVAAVADSITINPSGVGGTEGQQVTFAFNASSPDTDGSEKYAITLANLGEGAILYFNGAELTAGVTYDRATHTYTIAETVGIDYNNLSTLKVVQNDGTYAVQAQIEVHDGGAVLTSTSNQETFNLVLVQENATSGNNTLLYDIKGVDGLGGDDTVIFGTDWDNHYDGVNNLIDMSALKNIEKFDLTQHGDHHVVMTGAEVTAMTDSHNNLTIKTDGSDSITLKDDADNIWLNTGNDYTNIADGTVVHVNDPGAVTIERTAPTGGADIIGFDGSAINAGAGSDRIVVLDGTWNGGTINFSKLDNIEILDLSKSGDHDLGQIKLQDVINMTDGNNDLYILGNDANDKVKFLNEAGKDWTNTGQVTEGAKTFDVYTNNGDSTVTVKVEDHIMDSII